MIIKKFVIGILNNNVLLLISDGQAIVVDPAKDSAQEILQYTQNHSLEIKGIVLTHSHWDHIGDVAFLKEKTGALVYIHKLDAENLKKPKEALEIPLMKKIEAIDPDVLLSGKEKLKLGDVEIEVIHTPGHTPGSVCYYIPEYAVLISGDTLFKGGMGRTDFPSSSSTDMEKSLKKLAKLPSSTKVIPGHGRETSIEAESWLNF